MYLFIPIPQIKENTQTPHPIYQVNGKFFVLSYTVVVMREFVASNIKGKDKASPASI
jgi:hypothetical protein